MAILAFSGQQSPAASKGLTVIPSGRVTTARRACEGTGRLGLVSASSAGVRLKSKPLGAEARGLVACALVRGSKSRCEHSVNPAGVPEESRLKAVAVTAAGCCQELAAIPKWSGPPQEAGSVR